MPDNTGKTYKTHKIDPRATAFKRAYLDSHNPQTFCNITQSALAAGYSEEYAHNLSARTNSPKWYKEFQEQADFMRANMLKQAEKNINRTLTEEPKDTVDKKLQQDASKFVSERLGKDHYSTRKELTDKGGRKLFTNQTQHNEEIAVEDLFIGVSSEA